MERKRGNFESKEMLEALGGHSNNT